MEKQKELGYTELEKCYLKLIFQLWIKKKLTHVWKILYFELFYQYQNDMKNINQPFNNRNNSLFSKIMFSTLLHTFLKRFIRGLVMNIISFCYTPKAENLTQVLLMPFFKERWKTSGGYSVLDYSLLSNYSLSTFCHHLKYLILRLHISL